jgi:hypothetical protein
LDKEKTFPLRVTQEWLDKVDEARDKKESKHEFIINAANKQIKERGENK